MRKLFFEQALLPEGWRKNVVISIAEDDTIARVETNATPAGAQVVRGAALPGLANIHSHAFQRGMAGLAERAGTTDDSFWTWREVMYRFLSRLTPDDVESIAGLAYAEMLESGFTVAAEFHYLHHDVDGRPYSNPAEMAARIGAAALETGIGLVLLPSFYAHGNFKGAPPTQGQRRFLNNIDGFERLLTGCQRAIAAVPGARLGIAPHSLRAVTLEELKELLRLNPTGPVHMHVAEQTKEVEDCLAAHGKRPAELLFDTVPVDDRWCFVHATHTTDAERAEMARRGLVAGLCPITECNLGDGIFGAVSYLGAGGRFALGTDSNVQISATAELRLLEYSQRLLHRVRNALAPRAASTARTLFDAALAGGSQALNFVKMGLAPGARADIVVINTDHPAFAARSDDALLDALVFTAGERAVRDVWVRGRQVVKDGRHIHRDAIVKRYQTTLAHIIAN